MATRIPSIQEVRQALLALTREEVRGLCAATEMPFTTVLKIRGGQTTDPGLETVRAIWPHLSKRRTKAVA